MTRGPDAANELWGQLVADENGLVPCVVQDLRTRAILMVAWVSREALARTIESGYAVYYSRSRCALWEKGAVSGKRQRIVHIRVDNDHDTLLYLVDAQLPAGNDGSDTYFNYRRHGSAWVWDPVQLSPDPADDPPPDDATEPARSAPADLALRTQAVRFLEATDDVGRLDRATDLVETLVKAFKAEGLSIRRVLLNLEQRIKT